MLSLLITCGNQQLTSVALNNAVKILEQRYISLAPSRSSIALETEYQKALDIANEDGWHNWHDFFYRNILPQKPEDISLACHVWKSITEFLLCEYDKGRSAD